jgi:hypothetical protein
MALATAVLAFAPPAGAEQVPLPDHDPFYVVPPGIGGLPNGAILGSRPVNATALSVPMPARAWQVKYKTIDVHDRPSAYVTTVLIPNRPWTGTGPRPLVSYQTAEDGVGSKCAPSYALRAGLGAASSNSGQESLAIPVALQQGWAVAAPDYEGPRSEFLGAAGEARGVLDGVRAALAFEPGGLSPDTPVGLMGYSGGALATSLAAQLQPEHAPELRFAGIALGGVVADLKATFRAFNRPPFGGALVIGIVGLDRSYPEERLQQYLSAAGKRAVADSQHDCINDAINKRPVATAADFEATPDIVELPQITSFLKRVSPLGFRGTPTAPIYDYHAVNDQLAPIGPARALMRRYCQDGVRVQAVEDPVAEHISLIATGSLGAIDYLNDRFAGRPAPSNCPPRAARRGRRHRRPAVVPNSLVTPARRAGVGSARHHRRLDRRKRWR